MYALELLIRGALAGLAIAAPVGPVNVLCISRTLTKGRMAGLISGLGAAGADTVYGAVAAFSISFIIQFVLREEYWIRLIGGALLIAIGGVYYYKKPASLNDQKPESSHSAFWTAFALTLANPTTIMSYLAVLAVLGAGDRRPAALTSLVVAGIFCGSMIWWVILAVVSGHFRDRIGDRTMVHMNRAAAFAIGGFGVVTMILSQGK